MAPKLLSDDGRHIVIRPLAYVAERDIARYARGRSFPIIPCKLCGSQDNMQRVAIKKMLADWERDFPAAPRRSSPRCVTSSPNILRIHDGSISSGSTRSAPERARRR